MQLRAALRVVRVQQLAGQHTRHPAGALQGQAGRLLCHGEGICTSQITQ